MATQDPYTQRIPGPERIPGPATTPTRPTSDDEHGVIERWRERRAALKRARLVSARSRRALAKGLRRTANPNQPPARFDTCPLLLDRVTPERPQLLAIAAALEQAHHPDPTCVAAIRELLTNACSPLYNTNLPATDLHTTLNRVHAGLDPDPRA
jgi:hypothetical protein